MMQRLPEYGTKIGKNYIWLEIISGLVKNAR